MTNRFLITLTLFLAASATTVSGQQKKPVPPPEPLYDILVDSASTQLANENYANAVDLLKDFPASDTSYAKALLNLSLGYIGLEKYQDAIDCATKGISLRSPFKRQFYEVLGAAYDGLHNSDKSMAVLKEGLQLFPTYTRFWYQMGVVSRSAGKYEDAARYFQYALRGNPFQASAHLNLGNIMYKSNKMIPAMLSYYMFLLINTDSDKNIAVLKTIETIGNGEYKIPGDSVWLKGDAGPNPFSDLEAMINSKWALNPGYKSRIDLSYTTVVKTLQLIGDKLEYQAADTSFCMRFYVPLLLDMVKSGVYDASVYFSFRSLNDEDVRKALKKQEGNIEKMKIHVTDYLNKYRKEQWLAMHLAKNDPWFNNNGVITSDMVYNEKVKQNTGDCRQYWFSGNTRSEGVLTASGNLTGTWKYYYPEGELRSVKIYRENMLVDSSVFYYPSGAVEQVTYYVNDKANGLERTYYNTLGLKNKVEYANGVVTGNILYVHSNGQKELEATMLNDKLNGKLVSYHKNGVREKEQVFNHGVVDGPSKTWFANGRIESEGHFTDGNKDGIWTYYHITGGIDNTGAYKNGEQDGQWKSYNEDGKLSVEEQYTAGKNEGESKYYDEDGKVWSVFTYSKGILKKYKYIDKNGVVLSSGEVKGTRLELNSHYANGMKFRSRIFINDLLEGKATTWNKFGETESIENYRNDKLDGKQVYNYDSGVLHIEVTYRDGQRHGLYTEYYSNGTVAVQGWYKDGKRRGAWYEYRPDGSMSNSYFYQNGDYQGSYTICDVNGKPESVISFDDGIITAYTGTDPSGNIVYSEKIPNGTARIRTIHANKKTEMELDYKNGSLDGEARCYYCNGKPRWVRNFRNGEKNGLCTEYDWEGNLTSADNYVDGERDSVSTRYKDGKLYMKAYYSGGNLNGTRTWYYPNGKIETEGNFVRGNQEGYFSYYDDSGALRYRLFFVHGDEVSYSYQAADGSFVPEIPLPASTGEVKSFFSNGNPSAVYTYKCGYYNGPYIQYHSNGKLVLESTFRNHEKEGTYKEYNPAGKLTLEENYMYDLKHGVCRYYNNGTIQRESTYVMGKLHGPTIIYDKTGKLLKKIEMYNDEPCD